MTGRMEEVVFVGCGRWRIHPHKHSFAILSHLKDSWLEACHHDSCIYSTEDNGRSETFLTVSSVIWKNTVQIYKYWLKAYVKLGAVFSFYLLILTNLEVNT